MHLFTLGHAGAQLHSWASHWGGFACYRAWTQYLWLTALVALQHVGSSWTRSRTWVSFIGRWILSHWTTREVSWHPLLLSKLFVLGWHVSPLRAWGMCPGVQRGWSGVNLNSWCERLVWKRIMQGYLFFFLACREPKISDLVRRKVLPMQVQSRWGWNTWTLL